MRYRVPRDEASRRRELDKREENYGKWHTGTTPGGHEYRYQIIPMHPRISRSSPRVSITSGSQR